MQNPSVKAEYFAFISHKSTDAKYAKKLQKFIEGYNLPTKIRENTDIPKRLSPICAYEVDFSPNPLTEEMREKLRRSKYLIVLCSEELVKAGTKYVNFEIETFIELKREEGIDPISRIIPIIINGEFGSEEHECCPEALKALGDDCPIAVNRQNCKNDREVFLYAISGMLDIDFAVLKNRDNIRKLKRRLVASTTAAAVLVAAGFLAEYFIPRSYHYLDYVTQNGIPVGIEQLDSKEYGKVANHYVITKQKHKTVSVEYVNSKGSLCDHNSASYNGDRPAKTVYDYGKSGLSTVTYYDKNDNPYFVLQYSGGSANAVDFKDPYSPDQPYYIGAGYESSPASFLSDYNINSSSDISRFVYDYDKNGYITKVTFHADSAGRLAGDNFVFGFEYTVDDCGRVIEQYYLDASGNRRVNSDGVYSKVFVYDDNNDLVERKNLDKDGNAIADSDGMMVLKHTYDDNHNVVNTELCDENGDLMVVDAYGGAQQKKKVDKNGMLTEIYLYDEKGEPSSVLDYSGMIYTYDENGFIESETFVDSKGKTVLSEGYNYAVRKYVNDENGDCVEKSYFDVDGKAIDNADGYAREVIEYNASGKIIRSAYYDADGKLADYCGYGYSIKECQYDDRNRETSLSYFGDDEKPVNTEGPTWEHGYHKVETVYEYGATTKMVVTYYDKDGTKVNSISDSIGETYASTVLYIQNGDITSMTMYDKDGKQYGESFDIKTEYSAKAEKIDTVTHRNPDEEVIKVETIYHYITGVQKRLNTVYYEDGVKVEVVDLYYNENEERESAESNLLDSNGEVIQKYTIKYNEHGKPVLEEIYDYTNDDEYLYTTETKYENGVCVEEKSVTKDKKGNVKSESVKEYDEAGNPVKKSTTSYDGDLILGKQVIEYNKSGNISKQSIKSYDKNGEISMESESSYNDEGKCELTTTIIYTDKGSEMSVSLYEYNADGSYTVTTGLIDDNGEVYHVFENKYDSEGNKIKD